MHKFLMVDDEELIRTGFREKIDWQGLGLEFLEPCANGQQALEAVREHRPDVVMTDICMPQMDGLELCRILAQDYPEVRVVVLSGHDDFEYVRESLRNRVVDYLLKPVTSEELRTFLDKLGRELDRPRVLSEAEAFRRVWGGTLIPGQDLVWEGGSTQASGGWCAVRLSLFPGGEVFPPQVLENVERVLAGRSRPRSGLAVAELKKGGQVIHVDLAFPASDPEHAQWKASRDATQLLAEFHRAGFVGCGTLGSPGGLADFPSSLNEASEASVLRFFRPAMLESGVLAAFPNPGGARPLKGMAARLETLIREADRPALDALVEEFRRKLQAEPGNPALLRDDLAALWGPEGPEVLDSCPTGADLVAALEERIRRELFRVADQGATLAHRALTRLREEIERRLGEPELSIDEVSRDLLVSPSYLAKLLRRKWDTNFSRFLREARISRAKELLAATNLTTTSIAEQIGFHDYRYFSNQFKRSAGLTPSEYRNQSRAS